MKAALARLVLWSLILGTHKAPKLTQEDLDVINLKAEHQLEKNDECNYMSSYKRQVCVQRLNLKA